MYTKRASLITISTIRTLTKVCRTPYSSLYSIKTSPFCRNLSIATERSDFFTTTNEFNGENHQNNSNNYVQQNQNGFYGGNLSGGEQNLNNVYGQNPRNEFQHNPAGGNGNFSSGYVENGRKTQFLENNVEQNVKSSHGYIENGPKIGNFENLVAKNVNFDGRNGMNSQNTWQQNAYGYERGKSDDFRQNPGGDYVQSGSESSGGGAGCYGNVSGGFQQNTIGYSGANYANSQQNSYGSYSQNMGMPQHSYSNNYTGNAGNLQYRNGNNYAGNSGMYHENTGVSNGYNHAGGYQQTVSNSYGSTSNGSNNAGGYQQTVNTGYGSGAGFYQHTSNEFPNGNISTQGESSVKPNGESAEATEGSEPRGTIEELDKFCQEGKLKEAVKVLGLLAQQHISVDLPRYLILMKACGEDKALEEAKAVHEHLVKSGVQLELRTYNKILEMYCRCGSMDDAFMVFDKMPRRNLTSWDIMISWLGKNGHGEDAIELFTEFKEMGLKPDGKMFLGVFTACSVLGDSVEGLLHFESMSKDYGIVPSMEHYTSVVDMMGSIGHLNEALEFIEKMPINPSVEVWETLMNLCRMHGNSELGDYCAELVDRLDPSRLNEEARVGLIPVKPSDLAKGNEKKKLSGQSLLESRNRVHEYRAGDRSSPEHEKLYTLLRGMRQQMKEAGYIPETKFVLHDIDFEGKEEALMAHSERLAVAQGLMTTPARYPIRIIKNLRICVDCHNAMKIISKLAGRELIIRDAKRFHHFRDGLCSCRDYW